MHGTQVETLLSWQQRGATFAIFPLHRTVILQYAWLAELFKRPQL